MSNISISTIKKLFALSNNQCAFPDCHAEILSENGNVIGEICHINAQSQEGPRYNKFQSEKERSSFDNLLLLCPTHHSIIDNDEDKYSVDILKKIKKEHVSKSNKNNTGINDEIIFKLYKELNLKRAHIKTQIAPVNPIGGQYAESIKNVFLPAQNTLLCSYESLLEKIYSNNESFSKILAETIKTAKHFNDTELIKLCKNELSGFSIKGSPTIKYRRLNVYVSPYKIDQVTGITQDELWKEFSCNDDFCIIQMSFPDSVPSIENMIISNKEHNPRLSYFHLTQKLGAMVPETDDPEMIMHVYCKGSMYIDLLESIKTNFANELILRIS